MGIKGFQGTSLLDFPGRIASLLFWGGCNLTCPFCHNPPLVLEPDTFPDLDPAELLADLAARKAFIDGVVISGGEPTLDRDLCGFLREVKSLGLAVKLDTNGLVPRVLAELLAEGLVDYLAVDLKTTPQRYAELHPGPVAPETLLETLDICASASVELEYRTTCVPGWVGREELAVLGKLIDGTPLWALQQYHPEHALCGEAQTVLPYSPEEIEAFAEQAKRYAQRVVVRGL